MAAPDVDNWTLVLSGPLTAKGSLLGALDRAGVDVADQPLLHPSHGLPPGDPSVGWLTVRHYSVDWVAELAEQAGWALRAHYPTPPAPVSSPGGALLAELEDLRTRLAALEGR